jgi:hypothetical protein
LIDNRFRSANRVQMLKQQPQSWHSTHAHGAQSTLVTAMAQPTPLPHSSTAMRNHCMHGKHITKQHRQCTQQSTGGLCLKQLQTGKANG